MRVDLTGFRHGWIKEVILTISCSLYSFLVSAFFCIGFTLRKTHVVGRWLALCLKQAMPI